MMIIRNNLKTIFLLLLFFSYTTSEAQTLSNYAKQRKQEIAEMQRVEKQHYDNASKKGTLEAFKEYLKMYPKGIYVKDVTDRVTDFDMWNKAKSTNSKSSYNYYLANSKYQSFRKNAEEGIIELNSIEDWNNLKTDGSITSIQSFITKYPNSSCLSQTKKRIHELRGIDYYNTKDYLKAYSEFNEAGGKYAIDVNNRNKYDRCVEAYEYSKLSSYSKEKELESFLNSYPSSNYVEVSNWLAISKAKAFTMFSGAYAYNGALNYAKDETTKTIVKSYLEKSKKDYSVYQRQQRQSRIKANGGYFSFGIEAMDFGWNGLSPDKEFDVFYYNVGLSMKIGNFKAPVQFEIGLKPGVIWYKDPNYSYSSYDSESGAISSFHMPLYAKLKLNVCCLDKEKKSKLYICGLGLYNVVRDESLENEYSVGGGMGVAWRHWDWLTLYYRQDLNNQYRLDDKFIGTSCVYYF